MNLNESKWIESKEIGVGVHLRFTQNERNLSGCGWFWEMSKVFHGAMVAVNLGQKAWTCTNSNMDQAQILSYDPYNLVNVDRID